MSTNFQHFLLKATQSSACKEKEVIQSLWSGYGKISRWQLSGSTVDTVIVKSIMLDQTNDHPRGWNTDLSHNRKVKSYKVETYWYEKWNHHCSTSCRIPKFIGSFKEGKRQWIVMEDLSPYFPLIKQTLTINEAKVCLKWLAHFHLQFLNKKPEGLWEIGTYWHLQTRPEELQKMNHSALKAKAHLIDEKLNQCKYQTIVHGDAKVANFCFSTDGKEVAAVDFQYIGGGCGMKDVVYFLGSCLSASECEKYEEELLNFYFSEFEKGFATNRFQFSFKELETEWRSLYSLASADFTRFLLGWMPSHQKINSYSLNLLNTVLSKL